MPAREKPLVFAYGGLQTSQGCGVGWFTCHGDSRMCKEEALTWEPMDTSPMRKVRPAAAAAPCLAVSYLTRDATPRHTLRIPWRVHHHATPHADSRPYTAPHSHLIVHRRRGSTAPRPASASNTGCTPTRRAAPARCSPPGR